jgi:hypothetical protein
MLTVFTILNITILDNWFLKLIIILYFLCRGTYFFPAAALAFLFAFWIHFCFFCLYVVILNVQLLYLIVFIINVIFSVFNFRYFFNLQLNIRFLLMICVRYVVIWNYLRLNDFIFVDDGAHLLEDFLYHLNFIMDLIFLIVFILLDIDFGFLLLLINDDLLFFSFFKFNFFIQYLFFVCILNLYSVTLIAYIFKIIKFINILANIFCLIIDFLSTLYFLNFLSLLFFFKLPKISKSFIFILLIIILFEFSEIPKPCFLFLFFHFYKLILY